MDTLSINWKIPDGQNGKDISPENPLSRSINKLFTDKKGLLAITDFTMCFFTGRDGIKRWLGVFILTPGNRICFFPGYAKDICHLQAYQGKGKFPGRNFNFDHITYEISKSNWHLTAKRSKKHQFGPSAMKVDDDNYIWTGFSINNEQSMRVVKKETIATFKIDSENARRRADTLINARKDKTFYDILFERHLHNDIERPAFPHFLFLVSNSATLAYRGSEIGYPFKHPNYSNPNKVILEKCKACTHAIKLSDTIFIHVIAQILPGRLSAQLLFSSS